MILYMESLPYLQYLLAPKNTERIEINLGFIGALGTYGCVTEILSWLVLKPGGARIGYEMLSMYESVSQNHIDDPIKLSLSVAAGFGTSFALRSGVLVAYFYLNRRRSSKENQEAEEQKIV